MRVGLPSPEELYRELAAPYAPRDGEEGVAVHNPTTGALLATFETSTEADVDEAVAVAASALREWRAVPVLERSKILKAAAQRLREHGDEIATIESLEMGKTFETARNYDMEVASGSFEFFGSLIMGEHGDYFPGSAIDSYSVREPYGVVAGIIPFNWPPIHSGAKLAPALATGNVVILKPPEQCPLTVLHLVDVIRDLFPPGVIQTVRGPGAVTGAALVGHPGIDRISFTGSPAAAKAVLHAAADNFTGALLELGGKNPLVVFADADLDTAIPVAVEAAFMNQGQACTAASRILVHRDILEEFTERFSTATARLRLGDPLDDETDLGPVVTAAHAERIRSYIGIGIEEGAAVAYRGRVPHDPELGGGFFVEPVIFSMVGSDMRIAQEEIFGPVTAIMPFSTFEEAIEISNSTEFALVAGVMSSDPVTARRAAEAIDAGVVFVNNYNRSFLPTTPFGGNRASGYGREHVAQTLDEFSRLKSIRIANGLAPVPLVLKRREPV